ncbi:hypothetical protein CFP56_038507 [Quercus suber]|uniref:Myb/SANT-like domain-containing protein n=1 Tax=Quercus suber TaxID=58331 RepID=A0AAW0J258_QUESU
MTECTPKHVEHRFKTLKTNWNTIALLRNKKSKFGWKIITYDRTVYDEEVEKQVDPSHVASNETWSHRKRSHATMIEDAVYQDLSIQLGKVASAIEKISENQLNFGSLYEEVMKMDGFEENMLASTFDHLNGDEKQAKSFMLKIDKLHKQWL